MKRHAPGARSTLRLLGTVLGTMALGAGVVLGYANGGGIELATQTTSSASSQRAVYHLTPANGWLSDPQRPVYAGGSTNLY